MNIQIGESPFKLSRKKRKHDLNVKDENLFNVVKISFNKKLKSSH